MADFATRLRELRKSRNLRQIDLAAELGVAQTTIANYEQHARFPDEQTLGKIASFFDVSLDFLLGRTALNIPVEQMKPVSEEYELTPLARRYLDLLLDGKKFEAYREIIDAVEAGMRVLAVYRTVFEPCLKEIGRLWEINEVDVSQEHYFSAATETLMGQLYPYLEQPTERKGAVIAVAVGGELHEIGIRMVSDALEEAGWECYYLGVNTPTANVYRAIVERSADVLAISATLAFGIDAVRNMISYIRFAESQDGRKPVNIITGGRAFNLDPDLWKRVGADGCAHDPEETVRLVNWLSRDRQVS